MRQRDIVFALCIAFIGDVGCHRAEKPSDAIADSPAAGSVEGVTLEHPTVQFSTTTGRDHWNVLVQSLQEIKGVVSTAGASFYLDEKATLATGARVTGEVELRSLNAPASSAMIPGRFVVEITRWELVTTRLDDLVPTAAEPFSRDVGKASGKVLVVGPGPERSVQIAGTFRDAKITYLLTDEQRQKVPAAGLALVRPASKWTVAGKTLSSVTADELVEAAKGSGWPMQKGFQVGVFTVGSYEGIKLALAKGPSPADLTITRPAAHPESTPGMKIAAPADRAKELEQRKVPFVYDAEADIVVSAEAADAKRGKELLDALIKHAP